MWLKILGCVALPLILAWLTRIFWSKIWTADIKGLKTCHNYRENGPGSACRRICPLGYFNLPSMDDKCHPWLTCHDLQKGTVQVKVIGAGAVKKLLNHCRKPTVHFSNDCVRDTDDRAVSRGVLMMLLQVSLATWKGHMVAMNEPITELYLKDYRYGLDILQKLQGRLEVIQFVGSCDDLYVTQYHKYGSANRIENILGDLNTGQKDTMATRFMLCLNYVAILNLLHTHKLGTLVMCDSNDLEKTLKQYLVTDDLTLVLNDVDSLAKVNHSAGELIKCGHRQLGGEFVAPEQLWPYDAEFTDDSMPPYDEKSDIWKIPDVCHSFLGGHSDSTKVKLDLFRIHSACKEEQASHRPTAANVLREYEKVWNSINELNSRH